MLNYITCGDFNKQEVESNIIHYDQDFRLAILMLNITFLITNMKSWDNGLCYPQSLVC
jgi:hypothetical protein